MDNMIGNRIKERRKSLNITLKQIQEITDISVGNLSCIENGKYLPSAIALIQLSKILHCSIDWILTGEYSKSNISEIEYSDKEQELISYYRNLDADDQDELMMIAKMKDHKGKRKGKIPSSNSPNTKTNEIA